MNKEKLQLVLLAVLSVLTVLNTLILLFFLYLINEVAAAINEFSTVFSE